MQTPEDDMPFTTLSMSELHTEGRHRGSDWVWLLFVGRGIDLVSLLSESSFPSDYSPLVPDFRFLPVHILKKEVVQVGGELEEMKESVLKGEGRGLSNELGGLNQIKNRQFEIEKTHMKLRER